MKGAEGFPALENNPSNQSRFLLVTSSLSILLLACVDIQLPIAKHLNFNVLKVAFDEDCSTMKRNSAHHSHNNDLSLKSANKKNMDRLIPINSKSDIPEKYRNTPIGLLLEYHNLNKPFETYPAAQLLIGMCMDNRKHMHIPDNFSYIIRTGGANMRYSEFKISFAVGVGDVKHIALIGHNHCGMVNLVSKKDKFIEGLIKNAGWTKEMAEEHFMNFAPMFEIGNEIDFVLSEVPRLRRRYPNVQIAPILYLVEDNRLYLIKEN